MSVNEPYPKYDTPTINQGENRNKLFVNGYSKGSGKYLLILSVGCT